VTDKIDRRPLSSRDTGWARTLTRWLAATAVTPNQISIASMAAAALAGGAFWAAGSAGGGARIGLLLLAALGCQLRLICNLMDGLVAIEAGKQAPDGPFWNEFPDRIADILIIVGLGLGLGLPALGWAAASLAVLTAYVRELGRACGLPADYSGPMAKPQRMALVTAAALIATLEPLWSGQGRVLLVALWGLAIGTALTALRRAARLVTQLRAGRPDS
jgi:phosphatidylglycerophosphate synthase